MKKLGLILGLVLASLALAGLIVFGHARDDEDASGGKSADQTGLPWQIEALPSGASRVFGLTLADSPQTASTLGDAQSRWAADFQMAVIAAPGENGTLEAYVESAVLGFVTGKLVITAQVSPQVIQGFRERAAKTEYMDSTTRRYRLSAADAETALKSPILALAFIPQAQLDADVVSARFGAPAQRLRGNEHQEHWLYPDKGLSITLDSEGKELLQYVAPAHFARLRDPLRASQAH
jgi:hypothetical protein